MKRPDEGDGVEEAPHWAQGHPAQGQAHLLLYDLGKAALTSKSCASAFPGMEAAGLNECVAINTPYKLQSMVLSTEDPSQAWGHAGSEPS